MRDKDDEAIIDNPFSKKRLQRQESISYPAMNASLQYKLIGKIVKRHPEISEIMERYFGGNCLKRTGFKIQTLQMACILFGVEQKRLLQEFKEINN